MYKAFNPNPVYRRTEDCVIRAIAKAFDVDWLTSYDMITAEGRKRYDIPMANHVWIRFLEDHGYRMFPIPYTCPDCYSVREFAADHPLGEYVVGDGSHVLVVDNGDWYDSWNSGDMSPTFYLQKGD